jgi:hypothetical protein
VDAIAEGTRRPTWLGMNARYCYRSMAVNHPGPILVGPPLHHHHDGHNNLAITSNLCEMPDGRQTVNVHIPTSLDVVENHARQGATFPRESPLGHWQIWFFDHSRFRFPMDAFVWRESWSNMTNHDARQIIDRIHPRRVNT